MVNTHVHADHITGSGKLKTLFPECKSIISKSSGGKADIYVNDGELIQIGESNKTPLVST
jgi:sulfur dioxygenase